VQDYGSFAGIPSVIVRISAGLRTGALTRPAREQPAPHVARMPGSETPNGHPRDVALTRVTGMPGWEGGHPRFA
jgi:hypothetical protein